MRITQSFSHCITGCWLCGERPVSFAGERTRVLAAPPLCLVKHPLALCMHMHSQQSVTRCQQNTHACTLLLVQSLIDLLAQHPSSHTNSSTVVLLNATQHTTRTQHAQAHLQQQHMDEVALKHTQTNDRRTPSLSLFSPQLTSACMLPSLIQHAWISGANAHVHSQICLHAHVRTHAHTHIRTHNLNLSHSNRVSNTRSATHTTRRLSGATCSTEHLLATAAE